MQRSSQSPKGQDVLVLNYTMTCQLSCDFCCYGCNPGRTEKMPFDLAASVIEQAANIPSFTSIAFTGGEALVHWQEIFALAERIQRHNLPFSIATAAPWATTDREADAIVQGLRQRGLYRVGISADPSHEKFVPRTNVIRAAQKFSEAGVRTDVVGAFYSSNERLETYIPELTNVPGVNLRSYRVSNVGAAKKRCANIPVDASADRPSRLTCYRSTDHDVVVFHDGSVFPCCSVFNRAARGLRAGNVNDESLERIWERIRGSLLIRTLKTAGFSDLYSMIDQLDPSLTKALPDIRKFSDACELCSKVFGDVNQADRIKKIFETFEVQAVDDMLTKVEAVIGDGATVELIKEYLG